MVLGSKDIFCFFPQMPMLEHVLSDVQLIMSLGIKSSWPFDFDVLDNCLLCENHQQT